MRYRRNQYEIDPKPVEPPAFCLFLQSLHKSEAEAEKLVRGRSKTGEEIKAWVARNDRKKYVPNEIRKAMGLWGAV
jgi:hypothetical protein